MRLVPKAAIRGLRRRYANVLSLAFSWKTVLVEAIGVAGFVLVGCGAAALVTGTAVTANPMLESTIVGLVFGFAIFVTISATAHNNADELNPAVTVALIVVGTCPILQGIGNICGQVLGAIIGAAFLRAMLPESFHGAEFLGANSVPHGSSLGKAFLSALPSISV
jgi:glycerol uptake facilitator-like aquaporin